MITPDVTGMFLQNKSIIMSNKCLDAALAITLLF